jgi:hypothetical protein
MYAEPLLQRDHLVLIESTSEVVVAFRNAPRSFRRIENRGRWFRLNGRDRATGEMVYLPEVVEEP